MPNRDSLYRFLFEPLAVRGEMVHLDAAWQAVLERRSYPPVVRQILGETLAAAVLLSATIKFDGLLTLQIQARGPLRLLVAQVTSDRTLRALARWDGEPAPAPLCDLCGDGTLILTLDLGTGQDPYQGVVSLHGDTLAEALEEYFKRSEQIATRIQLAADDRTAAGVLLQRLPGVAATDLDGWDRLGALLATLQPAELLQTDAPTLARRLVYEEEARWFDPREFRYRCACSRQRTVAMLRALGEADLQQALDEQGALHVDCEFCGRRYPFDRVDLAGLFTAATPADVSIARH